MMRADHLGHKAGLAHGDVSGIEAANVNSGNHNAKADCYDLRKESEAGSGDSADVEKVAQLAKLYAAGTPSDEEFATIRVRVRTTGKEIEDKDNDAYTGPRKWSSGLARDPNSRGDAFDQGIEIAREESDFSAGLRAMESSIRVFTGPPGSKHHRLVDERALMRGRTSRPLGVLFIAALIAVAAFAWRSQGDEANGAMKRWALSLGRLLSMSTTESPPAPAAAPTSPGSPRPLEAVASDLVAAPHTEEQPAAEQKQVPDVATAKGVEQNTKWKTSSPLPSRAKRTPVPETRPTTIEGWILREVTNGTALLEGPNGIWKVKRGDTVPGVGRVVSIVLWGKRWIVATDGGLISTP
jgi:hypothetical protein